MPAACVLSVLQALATTQAAWHRLLLLLLLLQ
jgi:hypothetical protein